MEISYSITRIMLLANCLSCLAILTLHKNEFFSREFIPLFAVYRYRYVPQGGVLTLTRNRLPIAQYIYIWMDRETGRQVVRQVTAGKRLVRGNPLEFLGIYTILVVCMYIHYTRIPIYASSIFLKQSQFPQNLFISFLYN